MPGTIGYRPGTDAGMSTAATASNWNNQGFVENSGLTYVAGAGEAVTLVGGWGDSDGDFAIAVYETSGGTIGARVGSEVTVTVGTGSAEYTSVANIPLTNGTEYTIAVRHQVSGVSWNMRFVAGPGGTQLVDDGTNNTALPNPFGTPGATDTNRTYFFAVVTTSVALEQEGARFRNDDGSETTATWAAAQDANVTAPLGANLRLRVLVDTTDDAPSTAYTLRYKKSTDSVYVPVAVGAAGSAPVVEATAESSVNTAGTSHAVTLPAGMVESDLILITMDIGSTSATLNALTDWSEILDEASANGLKILRYTGTGVPSNPTFTSSASTRSASIAWRISGADKSVTPQIGTTATGTSTTPDPPSVTPSAGSKPYLFIAFYGAAGEEADDDTWSDTPPTNYGPTPPLQKACGTAGTNLGGLIAAASRQLTTGSAEDPGTFAKDVSAAWRAQTIIVHPLTPAVYVSPSANVTAGGEATTAQLTSPSGKTTSDFTTGRMWDDENGTDTTDIAIDDYSEFEWPLQAQSPAVNGDVYQFRVYAGTTPLDTYTVTPEWTIGDAGVEVDGNIGLIEVEGVAGTVTLGATSVDGSVGLINVVGVAGTAGPQPTEVDGSIGLIEVEGQPGTVSLGALTVQGNVGLINVVGVAGEVEQFASYPIPTSVSGRKILDQFGDPIIIRTFSSWKMANKLTNAEVTTAIDAVAANGFNSITVWCGGIEDRAAEGDQYSNQAGDPFWATTAGGTTPDTPWAMDNGTELGAAWDTVDWILEELDRNGMFLNFSFCAGFGTEGAGPDWEAATDADMHAVGVALATRYASTPNIVWHVMFDDTTTTGSTRGQRTQALFDGINDTEGPTTRPVRWVENAQTASTDSAGWFNTGASAFTINGFYQYQDDSVVECETIYAASATLGAGSTPVPSMDVEPPYDGAGHYSGNQGQQLRERSWAVVIEGLVGINYGQEDWWPFGGAGLFTEGLDWEDVQTHDHTVQQSYVWALVDSYMLDPAWAPTSAFVTTGEGSTDTKAAQGTSGAAAIAYFPNDRSVAVDTTIITGTGNVRLRWYDPFTGTFSTISAAEAQQTGRAVTLPAARGDGTRDFVLVVDESNAVAVDGNVGIIEVEGTEGTVTLGELTVDGSTGDIDVVGLAGTITLGATTVQGSVGVITVVGVAGTVALSSLTVQGNVGLIEVEGVPGTIEGQGVAVDGSVGVIEVEGVAGTVSLAGLTVQGSVGAINVVGVAGTVSGGVVVDPLDICIEVGAPVFRSRVTDVVLRDRAASLAMLTRAVGQPETVDRDVGDPEFVDRAASSTMVDRTASSPEFVQRSATVTFVDRSPGAPTFNCEE